MLSTATIFGRHSYCGCDFARATNCLTFCRSLVWLPSSLSVLVFESTPAGRTATMASTTLSGPSPPAMITGIFTLSTIFLSVSQLWVCQARQSDYHRADDCLKAACRQYRSRSVDAPKCRISIFSSEMVPSMNRASEESSRAEPLHFVGMAENIRHALSMLRSRGNEPSPTSTPM